LRTFGESASHANLAAIPRTVPDFLSPSPTGSRSGPRQPAGRRRKPGSHLRRSELETNRIHNDSPQPVLHLPSGRDGHLKLLEIFDAPSPNECYRREESLIPQQALTLTNGKLVIRQSRLLAGKIWNRLSSLHSPATSTPPPAVAHAEPRLTAFIEAAFEEVLSRPQQKPNSDCRQFMQEQIALYEATLPIKPVTPVKPDASVPIAAADPQRRAAESLVRSLFNHNDFLTVIKGNVKEF